MTDEELIRTYRRAETKGVAVILAAKAERTDVDTICRRLMAAGVAGNIRPTLRRVLRTHDLKNIPQQAIEEYLRKYGKSLKPKEPQKGCVDRYCEDCRYLDYYYGYKTCAYFSTTGIRRGCPAGEGCEKRELKRRRRQKRETGKDQDCVCGDR